MLLLSGTSRLRVLLASLTLLPLSNALLRFGCSQLVTERLDPLVTPGQISPHVHQIVGGNAFNFTMHPDLDIGNLATCTTCRFKEDKSNYWTAVLYFRHENGSYARVPQIPNHVVGNPNGGMTVYYVQPGGRKVTAFPKGFRMITGDPMKRSGGPKDVNSVESWALTWRCWESTGFLDPSNRYPPGAGPYDTIELPKKKCAGGIRANVFFPTCWDGKNLDSPDHHSHMAFMSGTVNPDVGILGFNGECPPTHPVQVPHVLYETYWDTRPFNNLWNADGQSQPFVLSMGDP
ncbi:WSC domain-containing protein [Coprinopsis cinerea AmutBmut pab1-1]|nr:WSC domain-containing protein [Coprinopsis cinerea AmutBmut pab1-1]